MIIHEKSRSVILKLKDPSRVTNVIPKSRVKEYKGQPLTQVHHGVDETRVLRNLGFEVPSPIEHHYEWRGKFKPFPHQLDTSSFFTLNRRCVCLNDMGCVDATTEYLSPTGWKRIDQYQGGQVAQYHPETGAVEFVAPDEYVKKPCPEMIRFKTSRGVDQLLSPEHRVLYVGSTGKTAVKQAHEVEVRHHASTYGWKGRFITTFSPDEVVPGVSYTDAELRLLVAVVADGHFPNNTQRVVVRLKRERKVQRLFDLLRDAGVPAKVRHEEITGFHVFTFQAPRRIREFDDEFWQCNARQLRVVADECKHWDGSQRKAGAVAFFSTSKASADFVQYAFAATGHTASLSVDARPGYKDCYTVHARDNGALLYLTGENAGTKSETVWREPSPDGFKYCFMVPSTFLLLRRNGCIFATGNTGKSLSALWSADFLMDEGLVNKCIIVCPMSTMHSVWANEVGTHFLFNRKAVVLHGPKQKRLDLLARDDVDFYIINHDGLRTIKEDLDRRTDIDLWIIDEAAAYRNAQTSRYKLLKKLIPSSSWLWLMTGTPCPTAPTDAWALARLIENPKAPKYFSGFKQQTMNQITQYKWVPKPDAYETAYSILQPGIRYRKSDVLKDMPPLTFQMRRAELTKDQEKLYKQMHKDLVMQLHKGGAEVTAANAAVKLLKLLQVTTGAVYDEFSTPFEVDASKRLKVLEELVEESNRKVIVFVPFTAVLDQVRRHLSKRWTVAIVDGRTGTTERRQIFDDFQRATDPHVLLAHPKTTAHGLTLTAADHTIWYAPIYSLETFEQANNRMDRPGQKSNMTISMIAANKLELELYKALRNKQVMQESVLSLYKQAKDLT